MIYDFQVKRIDGHPLQLSVYKGQVMLVVNTASKCGLTPQYEGLEKLFKKYHAKGLAVLGFPANEFLGQEPGTNAEIAQFCSRNYGVSFDMFEKVVVKGEGQAPLYHYLTNLETHPQGKGDIAWNFEKFVVGRDGQVTARFAPTTAPDDPALVAALEAALAKH